ncbi:hypothetical protein G9A89_010365 [Geosiphon pyriformis]|nr:hypothetical protein G9A89_010365 [Geosiphon pyriformis]
MSFELSLMMVFELWVFDKLFVAVMVDILLVAAVDKLEVDIQVIDILAVASLTNKSVDIVLGGIGNSELKTSNRSFDIDFPIINYLSLTYSPSLNVFVYHSSGKHTSPAATVDWLRMMNTTNSGNNSRFLDYCIVVKECKLECIEILGFVD